MQRFIERFVRDRRLVQRHALNTAIRVRIRKSSIPESTTLSENLSPRGIFFSTNLPLQVGTSVELTLSMPQAVSGLPAAEWCCVGHVVRVGPAGDRKPGRGFGVEFDCYEISGFAPAPVSVPHPLCVRLAHLGRR